MEMAQSRPKLVGETVGVAYGINPPLRLKVNGWHVEVPVGSQLLPSPKFRPWTAGSELVPIEVPEVSETVKFGSMVTMSGVLGDDPEGVEAFAVSVTVRLMVPVMFPGPEFEGMAALEHEYVPEIPVYDSRQVNPSGCPPGGPEATYEPSPPLIEKSSGWHVPPLQPVPVPYASCPTASGVDAGGFTASAALMTSVAEPAVGAVPAGVEASAVSLAFTERALVPVGAAAGMAVLLHVSVLLEIVQDRFRLEGETLGAV